MSAAVLAAAAAVDGDGDGSDGGCVSLTEGVPVRALDSFVLLGAAFVTCTGVARPR